ncbi:MAG: hypothetical protein WCR72_00970 [Bacteroidota bacterium]
MHKLIIIILFLTSLTVKSQNPITVPEADSMTYQYYLSGDWDKLIETGRQLIAQHVDFKRLYQRMGYAYFNKADYFAAQKQYEKALSFDKYDEGTREYLYYCGINTGNEGTSRYRAKKLPAELKNSLGIKAIKPFAAVDMEYNYKLSSDNTRSDPAYFRAGLYSQLGYRLSVYQSVSDYKQTVNSIRIKQPDYFALLKYSITAHTSVSLAYHYLNTSLDGNKYPGTLLFAAVSTTLSRYTLGLNGSKFAYDLGRFKQFGLHAGVILPGKSNFYFNTYLSELFETNNNRMIFSQNAGARVYKTIWAEGLVTLGNIQNYNDHNALYLYNSIDPTVFRTGFSLFWHLTGNITFYGNYLYDRKQVEQTTDHYLQQSFLGGIIWKH